MRAVSVPSKSELYFLIFSLSRIFSDDNKNVKKRVFFLKDKQVATVTVATGRIAAAFISRICKLAPMHTPSNTWLLGYRRVCPPPPTVSHAVHPVVVGLVNVTSTQADHALPSVATARIMSALLLKVRRERRAAETKHRT